MKCRLFHPLSSLFEIKIDEWISNPPHSALPLALYSVAKIHGLMFPPRLYTRPCFTLQFRDVKKTGASLVLDMGSCQFQSRSQYKIQESTERSHLSFVSFAETWNYISWCDIDCTNTSFMGQNRRFGVFFRHQETLSFILVEFRDDPRKNLEGHKVCKMDSFAVCFEQLVTVKIPFFHLTDQYCDPE